MKKRIAIISDTHDLLRPEVVERLAACDSVIHAGDFSSQRIVDQITEIMGECREVYFVRGNNDKSWAEGMPEYLECSIEGVRFLLIHNYKMLPKNLPEADIIVFGHSHKYLAEQRGDVFWLNPGSCGKRRFHQEISMAVVEVEGGKWSVEKIVIEHSGQNVSTPGTDAKRRTSVSNEKGFDKSRVSYIRPEELGDKDRLTLISSIFKRMDRGQTVTRIASDLKVDSELVEDICRIRVTHPGVSPQEILDKMEVNRAVDAEKRMN